MLAGLSPTWYTYLEQARDIHPSPEVLDSLAVVLQLSEDERRYVHVLAHGQPPAANIIEPGSTTELLTRIVNVIDSSIPAYAGTRMAEITAWNHAATEWYCDFSQIPPHRRNMLVWMFTDPRAKERFVDWEDAARDLLGRFRAVSAQHQGSARLQELIDLLQAESREFRGWWTAHDIHGQQVRERALRHPRLGIKSMEICVVYPVDFDDTMVVLHLPGRTNNSQ